MYNVIFKVKKLYVKKLTLQETATEGCVGCVLRKYPFKSNGGNADDDEL